jgi:DNA-binding beta-propeller fold protein YncE
VGDTGNHRIHKFNASTGAYVGWIGRVNSATGLGGGAGCSSTTTGNATPTWCTGGTAQSGAGDGMFNTLRGIWIDANNVLYVADSTNHRIVRINAATGVTTGWIGQVSTTVPTGGDAGCTSATNGNFTPGWCTGGTANTTAINTGADGRMDLPYYLQVDTALTNLYVADTNTHTVRRYNVSNGAFTGWIGSIGTTGGTCTAGVNQFTGGWCVGGVPAAGAGDGMLNGLKGVTIDEIGDALYVGDANNHRVGRYVLSTGTFDGWVGRVNSTVGLGGSAGCSSTLTGSSTPGWCTGGTSQSGNGNGALNLPAAVTIGVGRVYLYAADDTNSRVSRFLLSTGVYAGSLGATQNNAPAWIASGVPIVGTGDATFSAPFTSATDGTHLYVANTSNHRIDKFDASTGAFVGWIGRINASPTGGAGACNGATSGTFTPGWCTGGTAQSGTGDGMLSSPTGMVVRSGVIYISDTGNHRISSYNASTGAFLGWYGRINSITGLGGGTGCSSAGTGTITPAWCTGGTSQTATTAQGGGGMNNPRGMAVSNDGSFLYVADSSNHRILRVNRVAGSYSGWTGRVGTTSGNCTPAASIPTVGFCNATGTATSGSNAATNGSMNTPYGVAVDPVNNDLLVADTSNNRINRYNSSGQYLGFLGRTGATQGGCVGANVFTNGFCTATNSSSSSGTGDGMLNAPRGVTFDTTGAYLYVADYNNHRIAKYNYTAGTFVGWQGNVGTSPTGGDVGCSGTVAGTATPGWCTGGTGALGNGNGMFNLPQGLSSDSSSIYIGDSTNHRIIRMDQ